jgi:hypothetical protein
VLFSLPLEDCLLEGLAVARFALTDLFLGALALADVPNVPLSEVTILPTVFGYRPNPPRAHRSELKLQPE